MFNIQMKKSNFVNEYTKNGNGIENMKKILLFSAIIIGLYFSYSCECKTCRQNESFNIQVPDFIFNKVGEFIASKTGDKFYKNNFFPDFVKSKALDNKFEVHFNFRMLNYAFVDNDVWMITDSTGKVLTEFGVSGVPNCIADPGECTFNIDREKAIEIACANGMVDGITELKSLFKWDAKYDKYVWHILNVLTEIGDPKTEMYKASGDEMIIDSFSGKVIVSRKWKIN